MKTEFSEFYLSAAVQARLDANKFITPTPVQAGAIPPAMEGQDVLATAQTGTGKTLSFLIPIVEMLQRAQDRNAAQALILLPTREWALQVETAFKSVRTSPLQTVALVVAHRQTLCYSATLDRAVKEVAGKYLNNPVRIEIGSVLKPAENVELRTFEVEQSNKQELLEHLLSAEKGSFLVFVRTKHGADRVARRLVRSGWSATQIHGGRSQSQRNTALRSFSEGHHRVLVATDVASRGIDVAHVAHVVNYDLPKLAEDFVHRVGRTGRADARGVASTFAGAAERGELKKIERALSIQMKRFRVRSVEESAA